MNFPSLLAGRLRIAAPPQLAVLLAVLLTIALAGSALANRRRTHRARRPA